MLSAIAAQARDLTRRLGLAGFGRWWAQELWSFVPARAKDSIERRRARPVLVFDGKVATLWRPQVNGRLRLVESAKIPLDAGETSVVAAGRAALAAVARPGSPGAEVIVALPPRAVLRKTLTLPAAIEDDLRQALAFDLDRHTPFRADEIYFDAAVVDRDASRNALIVDLVAVRRAIVDPMLRHAENFGARVVAVVADPPERAAASRVNLLPDDRRTEASTWTRWRVVAPAALLAILALAALVLLRCGRSARKRSHWSRFPKGPGVAPKRRKRCAPSSSARSATTTSRCSASTPIRERYRCSTTSRASCPTTPG